MKNTEISIGGHSWEELQEDYESGRTPKHPDIPENTPYFEAREDLWKYCLKKCSLASGLYAEFGVGTGYSINWFAKRLHQKIIHGFDSFNGLPEDFTPWFLKGCFREDASKLSFENNVVIHPGMFEETLPKFSQEIVEEGVFSFVHIDSDLYSSAKTIFDTLGRAIVSGTVLVFDEYHSYVGWHLQGFKAFEEFCCERNMGYKWLGWSAFQAGFEMR